MAKLYFRYAAMGAGKSTELLQTAHNYGERGMTVALFTAGIDTRNGVGIIGSRMGLRKEATPFGQETTFAPEAMPQGVACVLVDEAQFLLSEQVKDLHRYAHTTNTPVMCFGLRTDFRGTAFEGSAWLLALADDLQELKTVCRCGRKATLNIRVDGNGRRVTDGEQVCIGGNERYVSICGDCYYSKA